MAKKEEKKDSSKIEQEIKHEKEEQDKVAMGFRDVEMRKLNRE